MEKKYSNTKCPSEQLSEKPGLLILLLEQICNSLLCLRQCASFDRLRGSELGSPPLLQRPGHASFLFISRSLQKGGDEQIGGGRHVMLAIERGAHGRKRGSHRSNRGLKPMQWGADYSCSDLKTVSLNQINLREERLMSYSTFSKHICLSRSAIITTSTDSRIFEMS